MQASIVGVSRVADNDRALLVSFDRVPRDNELRMIHEILQSNEYAWKNVHILERARQEQDKKYEALQAKLDSVMFEYCPEDMTQEQVETWAKHQRPASKAEMKEIGAALNKDKP